ncbi:hypothetical protein FACS189421_01310 [Bacteroidia bacterium]|nr:hypothetical protein FACS189421_01310 [Bacteroidia bacterium]GHT04576.1 hypothetical protein FACS189423_07470 [Bacteroidia bacterium]GHT46085.1 hypothetical protein FACS189440_03360 [Bacteroidia bacterium]
MSQNLDSIPKPQRDSILLVKAKETVLKYGPGYYREYKEPQIERGLNPSKGSINKKGIYPNRVYYRVTFLYDKTQEQLSEKYAATVIFWADQGGEPASIGFGNGIAIGIPENSDLRSNTEIEPIPYQPMPKIEMIINEQRVPDK